jgi:mannosyltransferase
MESSSATGSANAKLRVLILGGFGLVITLGCVLRFWKLTDVGLWYDELWAVVGASDRPFMEVYREWILADSHPPGFFLFNFLWFKIVPTTEFWARIPHAMTATVTVLYLLVGTRDVLTRDERVMSASLMSLCYLNIRYALEVKQYSAMILLATVATMSYLRIVQVRRVDHRTGITLSATCVGLAYLNYFATAYAAILLLLLALTFRGNRRLLRDVVRLGVGCGLCYLPIAYFLYLQLLYTPGDWQSPNLWAFFSDFLAALFVDDPVSVRVAVGLFAGSLLVMTMARPELRTTLRSGRNLHLLMIWISMTGFMLMLGLSKPIFFPRYFLVAFPVFFIGVGILTAAMFPIRTGWLAIVPLVFFVKAGATQFRAIDTMQRQQWDKSVDLVLEWNKPGDRIYVLGANTDKTSFDYLREGNVDGLFYVKNVKFYEYYFKRRGAPEIAAKLEVVEPTVESVMKLAERFLGTGTTVYVLAGHHIQYSGDPLTTLEQLTQKVDITVLYSTLVYRLTF